MRQDWVKHIPHLELDELEPVHPRSLLQRVVRDELDPSRGSGRHGPRLRKVDVRTLEVESARVEHVLRQLARFDLRVRARVGDFERLGRVRGVDGPRVDAEPGHAGVPGRTPVDGDVVDGVHWHEPGRRDEGEGVDDVEPLRSKAPEILYRDRVADGRGEIVTVVTFAVRRVEEGF